MSLMHVRMRAIAHGQLRTSNIGFFLWQVERREPDTWYWVKQTQEAGLATR